MDLDQEADSMPPSYRHDPIVEAIVEFTFEPGSEWNITFPGRLYDRLQDQYPEQPKQREVLEAGLAGDAGGDPSGFMLTRKGTRLVFSNANKLVMVGPNLLSLHSLRPYEGWGSFLPRIQRAMSEYVSVAAPRAVRKVNLRYINRVDIPEVSFSLLDYFTITQGLPDAFPAEMKAFADRMELVYDDIVGGQIVFTWATTAPPSEGYSSFLLDFDLHWEDNCPLEESLVRLKELRRRQREAFESVINEKMRELFNAD